VPCGEHSERHGDHCRCDSGYHEAGGTCVPVVKDTSCGKNGHRHGATCVCMAGFIYSTAEDACIPVGSLPVQEAPRYLVLPLGEQDTSSGMNAVNDHLQVTGNKRPRAGVSYLSAYTQSVSFTGGMYTPEAVLDIGILPHAANQFSRPWDINWYGVVVGESANSSPILPFIFIPGTGLRQLKLPAGSASAVAHGINDAGAMVGIGGSRAIYWPATHATPTYLPAHKGATELASRAWKINERGDIVGHARSDANQQHATLWLAEGGMIDLGSLSPSHASEALDINESRQVVGKSVIGVVAGSTSGTLQTQAFIWEEGAMRGLGLLPSEPEAIHSQASAINDSGWVVGHVEKIAGLALRAVLWRDGVILDLNTLLPVNSGWVLTSAVDINSHGDIVGRGTFAGGSRPFVLIRAD
jgi:probable HAF family extracellular repeat protein